MAAVWRGCWRSDQIIQTDWSADDLVVFRTAFRGSSTAQQVNWQNHRYEIDWSLWDGTLYIIDLDAPGEPTLSFNITALGHVVSIDLDGVSQNGVPESWKGVIHAGLQKAYELSSHYQILEGSGRFDGVAYSDIKVAVIQRGLMVHPEYHLAQLGQKLKEFPMRPWVTVHFLQRDGRPEPARDVGGLLRDYLDHLFRALVLEHLGVLSFTKREDSDLVMPEAQGDLLANGFTDISEDERSLYQQIGTVLLYAYSSAAAQHQLLIGRKFDNALFRAAFSLTPREINTAFRELLPETIDKMIREILLERRETEAAADLYVRILTQNPPCVDPADWNVAFELAERCRSWDMPPDFAFIWDRPDHQRKVQDCLKEHFQLESLAPVHAIARGIREVADTWRVPCSSWRNFANCIQGSVDRDQIAGRIAFSDVPTPFMREQVRWIQEWIRNPQTPASEIADFVKFVTGSSSLGNDQDLNVRASYGGRIEAHTCFHEIRLPPDQDGPVTAASYITDLKFLIAEHGAYNIL
ncbi:MAG: hypothetical protein KGI83_00925 [Verrucomicrobiota bacterium]|nr:hypothetical protein [Verrucomicrobiota bacterium]